ncbi:glycosyltransferase family 4 protein [Kitasatospora sp. NPDC001159]
MPDHTAADSAGARPRVLHLISDSRRGGAQNFARDLHRELRRRGQASALCALAPHPAVPPARSGAAASGACTAGTVVPGTCAEECPDTAGLRAAAVLGPGRLRPSTLRALRSAARSADVVLAHGSDTLATCALALVGTRTPFVYVSVGHPRYWTASRLRRLRGGALMYRAAAVTTLTDEAREVLEGQFQLPGGKVRVIPNSRAAESYPPADGRAERRAARRALGLPADVLLVAWIGAIAPEKRLDLALDVLDRLPDVRLAVAGDGPLRETLARHPAAARAHFLGPLPDPVPLYRAADALLLTSDSEGVPGALIEAALAGVPAVATDVGWVREVVRDGATGALVAPGDPLALAEALAKVLACNRAGLGAAARAHALEHFELGAVVDDWQRLVAEVWTGAPDSH